MLADGRIFFLIKNGIWMTSAVPARFIGFAPS
jgi:RNA:NAD 2'-phosphotransferase (TPT1/KptA family)